MKSFSPTAMSDPALVRLLFQRITEALRYIDSVAHIPEPAPAEAAAVAARPSP